jgi:hypothetical protein
LATSPATTTVLDDALRPVDIPYPRTTHERKGEPIELPDKAKHAAEHAKEGAAERSQRMAHAAEKAEAVLMERCEKLHEAEEDDVRWHHLTGLQPDQRKGCDQE